MLCFLTEITMRCLFFMRIQLSLREINIMNDLIVRGTATTRLYSSKYVLQNLLSHSNSPPDQLLRYSQLAPRYWMSVLEGKVEVRKKIEQLFEIENSNGLCKRTILTSFSCWEYVSINSSNALTMSTS